MKDLAKDNAVEYVNRIKIALKCLMSVGGVVSIAPTLTQTLPTNSEYMLNMNISIVLGLCALGFGGFLLFAVPLVNERFISQVKKEGGRTLAILLAVVCAFCLGAICFYVRALYGDIAWFLIGAMAGALIIVDKFFPKEK